MPPSSIPPHAGNPPSTVLSQSAAAFVESPPHTDFWTLQQSFEPPPHSPIWSPTATHAQKGHPQGAPKAPPPTLHCTSHGTYANPPDPKHHHELMTQHAPTPQSQPSPESPRSIPPRLSLPTKPAQAATSSPHPPAHTAHTPQPQNQTTTLGAQSASPPLSTPAPTPDPPPANLA